MRFEVRVAAMPKRSWILMTPEPSNLHVMARQFGARADQYRFRAPPYLHGVVGDETMAADDQIQRAFAFSDAALADDEDAEAENVEQHAMQQLASDEAVLEDGGDFRDGDRRRHQRAQHRKVAALGLEDDFAEHTKAAGDEDARHLVVLAYLAHGVGAIGGIQAFEVAHLAVAEDQDASLPEIFVKAREREAGFLRVGAQDAAVEAAATGENFEIESQRFGAALKQFADRHAAALRRSCPLTRPCCAHRRRGRHRPNRRRGPFALLPLAFYGFGLLQHLLDRGRQRRAPRPRRADAGEHVVLTRVHHDFGHDAVLLPRQHDLRRHERLAEPALELGESCLDEPSESGGDFYLSTGQQ